MTAEQILKVCEGFNSNELAWEHSVCDWSENGLKQPEMIDEQNGNIGDTAYSHKILYFKDQDVYIKLEGWYSSYEGCEDYDDAECHIVTPVTKEVTFYE